MSWTERLTKWHDKSFVSEREVVPETQHVATLQKNEVATAIFMKDYLFTCWRN